MFGICWRCDLPGQFADQRCARDRAATENRAVLQGAAVATRTNIFGDKRVCNGWLEAWEHEVLGNQRAALLSKNSHTLSTNGQLCLTQVVSVSGKRLP